MSIYSSSTGSRRTTATAGFDGFPLFRMNSAQTKLWLIVPSYKRQLADIVAKTYNTGVVMLSATLYAIATVNPRGGIIDLPPPHKQFHMWQVINRPSVAYNECACRKFWDPESGDEWGKRDKERMADIHHPFCQFKRTADAVFQEAGFSACERVHVGQSAQARPDEWVKIEEKVADS